MKKNIIMISIIVVCITSLLLVIYNVNKNTYYISDVSKINKEEMNISMSQEVGNEETVITETPTSGSWKLETECTRGEAVIRWSNKTYKLKVKVQEGPIKCSIRFEELKANINIISMEVNGQPTDTLNQTKNYKLIGYECTNEEIVNWDNDSKKVSVSPLTTSTSCTVELGEIKEYSYIGSAQTFTAPEDGWYRVELWGASGGNGNATYTGGKGGYTSGIVELSDGETLQVNVGGAGITTTSNTISAGGWNGGGSCITNTSNYANGCGGGATDVRYGGTALKNRIMVAGAGGGGQYRSDSNSKGGKGGNLIGESSNTLVSNYTGSYSIGGTQTAGGGVGWVLGSNNASHATNGSFGAGGSGVQDGDSLNGGGAGWYGGGSGGYMAGGGGSSYISGYAGSNSVNSSGTHTAQTNSTANGTNNKYFIAGEMQQGVNEGYGYARITYEGASKLARINTALNNVRYIKDCATNNTLNNYIHWDEIQAIKDGVNLAKSVGSIDTTGDLYIEGATNLPYSATINGRIASHGATSNNPTSPAERCLTIDLEQEYDLDEIMVLHLASEVYPQYSPYYNNVTYVAGTNKSYREVIHTIDKAEDSTGKRVGAYGNYYTMTNLITNGSFEEGIWSIIPNNSIIKLSNDSYHGSKSLETKLINSNLGEAAVNNGQEIQFNPSHIYYARFNYKFKNCNGTCGVQIFFPLVSPYPNALGSNAQENKWSFVSNRVENTGIVSGQYMFRMDLEAAYSQSATAFFDAAMVIDLTETFGYGKEPSKAWLDANLEYIDGTKRIYLPY